jgi:hypothetical protein
MGILDALQPIETMESEAHMHDIVQNDRRLTTYEITEDEGISYGLCKATGHEACFSQVHTITANMGAERKSFVASNFLERNKTY